MKNINRFSIALWVSLICMALIYTACDVDSSLSKVNNEESNPNNEDEEDIRKAEPRWLDKASRAIYNGELIQSKDEWNKLLKMSEEDAVAEMMKDQRFSDTLRNMFMAFLDERIEEVRTDGKLSWEFPENYPMVESAIKAIENGGDVFDFFNTDLPWGSGLTDMGFWFKHRNSSTNFNRGRAAYILKTFFCDDLTPLSVIDATSSDDNRHATDPACMACHYKLDPIAGIFRNNGLKGKFFSDKLDPGVKFLFDDLTELDQAAYDDYLSNWKDESGEYKVGYYTAPNIRDPLWDDLKLGNTIDDLFKFMKHSPVVKQCFVKKTAEFFLGPKQVYDIGWLEHIAMNFKPGEGSADSYKKLISKIIRGNTFRKEIHEEGVCYDHAPGQGNDGPPCTISYLISKNCATCHSNKAVGVDFSDWQPKKGMFWHKDKETGQQMTKSESFTEIMRRMNSRNPQEKMPLNMDIPDPERTTIYNWFNNNK